MEKGSNHEGFTSEPNEAPEAKAVDLRKYDYKYNYGDDFLDLNPVLANKSVEDFMRDAVEEHKEFAGKDLNHKLRSKVHDFELE